MAVTVQTYTATATWTASDLANTFRSSFIDAGLMTEWFDSFNSSGIENRVLEIQYSGATYGKTYYWFQFTTTGVFISVAAAWNAASDVPSGTLYLDYIATTTNATTNHQSLVTLSAATTATITRYSSGVTSGFAFFLVKNGTTTLAFHVPRASAPLHSWLDLSKGIFHQVLTVAPSVNGFGGKIELLPRSPLIRRSLIGGAALNGSPTLSRFVNAGLALSGMSYGVYGITSNTTSNYPGMSVPVLLPIGINAANPAFSTDSIPIFTGLPYSSYINEGLPSDIGITFHYANNTMAPLDTFTVTPGSEVWEILAVTNSASLGGACPMLVARTT